LFPTRRAAVETLEVKSPLFYRDQLIENCFAGLFDLQIIAENKQEPRRFIGPQIRKEGF
jgi:hypothetical protein